MLPWYDRAFGPWYLKLYPHRDRGEADRALEALAPFLPAAGPVLDLGCGSGRHLRGLGVRGLGVFGLDRSRTLLAAAAADGLLRGRLTHGDMRRLPFRGGTFSAVLSMFTSFGYFESAEVHLHLLAEMARVARPGGALLLDYLNAPQLRTALEPRTERVVGEGFRVTELRHIELEGGEERVVKEVAITEAGGGLVERYAESVALYDAPRLLEMLREAGWREQALLGDYAGGPWSAASPRLIVVAGKVDDA